PSASSAPPKRWAGCWACRAMAFRPSSIRSAAPTTPGSRRAPGPRSSRAAGCWCSREPEPPLGVWEGMKPLAIVGIVLIVLGIAGLVIENVSFTERKTVLDVGPLKVQADEQKVVPIPTIAGVAAIVVGLGLVFMGRRRA